MEEKDRKIIRIALIGPESTSKSTLSELLAKHYHTVWVPEYARTYLATLNRKYTFEDILFIAREQLKHETELLAHAHRFIFADTELIISKVWCVDVFETNSTWIDEAIISHQYDFYLLTYPDLSWEADPLRENPHRRIFFFNWYEEELKKINANYTVIKGEGEQRLKNSVLAIEQFLAQIKK